jgi:zinc transport system substrate-binding protein
MKKISKYLLISLTFLLFVAACSPNEEENTAPAEEQEEQIEVVTSIFPVYEMTKTIAADEANISVMVGASEDAHHYEPSAQAVAAVNEADIFIYSSDEMEFWVESLLAVVENEELQVIELAEGLDLSLDNSAAEEGHEHDAEGHTHNHEGHEHEDQIHESHTHEGHDHDHGGVDPHFWLDPVAVNDQLPLIVEALIAIDSENEETYRANGETFSNQLTSLHQSYEEAFQDASNRDFVVQHQAFGHLANRYDLNQIAVGGLTTEVEPAPRELAEIVDFVNEQAVPVVYYQSGENSAIAETIAAETGTDIAVLHDLESEPANLSGQENGYLEAMYQNLEQLQKSIQ